MKNEERDHKKLGPRLGLFYIDPVVGKGLPMFLPKGAVIKRELEKFIVEEETRRGYQHVATPDIARLALYQKSGHYPYYQDSMYAPIVIDDEQFMLRPMTCPHHFQLYLAAPHSYRELPLRIAELAKLYRYEQSGEIMGLQRTRAMCLADAHIICADEQQAEQEIGGALDLIEYVAGILGLKLNEHYRYRLSLGDRTNDKKYFKNDAAWAKGEALLRALMRRRGSEFEEAKNEAAFYGPKIDIQMRNINGKEDTAFTVQYDFCMPERFDLTYIDSRGGRQRALVVHRSSIGTTERIIAFLIEHYAGAFPLWLAPVQVAVLPIGEKQNDYARKVFTELKTNDIRTEINLDNHTLGKKIRDGKAQKIPYLAVIGDKEIANGKLTVGGRREKLENISLPNFLTKIREEISSKK
ncbi:MAG: threonine--tRNA ligase [Candidatus Vogelbacteria bacterium]|nr:threonine--tRNA ligase [Candidatus Vogelbacteria bacterium]